jgi:putative membrane protein
VIQLFAALLLHAGGVDPTGWLWSDWNIQPTVAIGLLALVAGYLYVMRGAERPSPSVPTLTPQPPSPISMGEGHWKPRSRLQRETGSGGEGATPRQKAAFIGGALTLFVALGPPLDDWSDHYLLLAHMVQHLLIILLAAPLLLAGTPGWLLEPLTRNRVTNAIGYWLTRPLIAFIVANAVFVLWHLPLFYEMALRSEPIHVLEHMTLLATALLAWWPILGPLPQWPRLALPLQSLYFFAMTIPGAMVGAFITYAEPGLYSPYDTARRIFGIDLATDQQAAGLLMWVVVSAIYLLLITFSFFRWARQEETAERQLTNRDSGPGTVTPVRNDSGVQAAGS